MYNNPEMRPLSTEGCIMVKAHKGKGKTKILCQLLKDLKLSEKRELAIDCRQTFDMTICQRLLLKYDYLILDEAVSICKQFFSETIAKVRKECFSAFKHLISTMPTDRKS